MARDQEHDKIAEMLWSMPLDDQLHLVAMICATTNVLDRMPRWYRQWITRQANYALALVTLVKIYKEERRPE